MSQWSRNKFDNIITECLTELDDFSECCLAKYLHIFYRSQNNDANNNVNDDAVRPCFVIISIGWIPFAPL